MSKKSFLIDACLLAGIFIAVVGGMVAVLFYHANLQQTLLIAGIAILAVIAIMGLKNYRYSAYGRHFANRYPSSKASMSDQK